MSRKLFLAPFGAHNATERLLEQALRLCPEPARILYLTPSPRKLRDTQLRFARLVRQAAFIPPTFATARQLARDLHELYGRTRRFPAELKPLLIRRLLPDTGPKPTIGYARAVSGFIREVKAYVPPDQLGDLPDRFSEWLAGHTTPLCRALEALDTLNRYQAELDRHGWSDDEDIVLEAARHITDTFKPPRVLILDSFIAPSAIEQTLLAALIESAETTLALGYEGKEQSDYRLATRFRTFLDKLGGFEHKRIEPGPDRPAHSLFSFPSMEDEVTGIARHLRTCENLSDTVVAFPNLTTYAPLVRRIFGQYDIGCTTYPDTGLASSPPVVAVLELLRALDTDYERVATTAAFSSPYLPGLLGLPADATPDARDPSAAALNYYSRRAGIIKGRANWENIAARISAAQDREPGETEARLVKELESRLRKGIKATRSLARLGRTLGHRARALKELLGRLDFYPEPVADQDQNDILLKDRKKLYDMLDSIFEFEVDFGPEPSSVNDFCKTIRYLIGTARSEQNPALRGVLVVNLDETLGLHPAHVCLGGLTETNLPGTYASDPILPDSVRVKLGMPGIDWHRDWQRFHLARSIEASCEPPFLCFHDTDQGRPVLPTPFLQLAVSAPADTGVIYAPIEQQLDAGQSQARPFAETGRTVDFSSDSQVLNELLGRFGPARPIAVTGIESYQACPYRFYLERVLRVDSPPEPLYEIDALQWGSVIHRTLEQLYAQGPLPPSAVRAAALKALDHTLAQVRLPTFWAQVTRRVFDNLLPAFVACEEQLRADGFEPVRTETSVSGTVAPGILIKGRLDRVDASPDSLRVLDYKTGSVAGFSAKAVVKDHTHVQLPLYAELVRGQNPERRIDNMGVYSLRDPRVIWLATSKFTAGQLIQAALETTTEAVDSIRSGRFPAEPADDRFCRYCDYGYTCGRPRPEGDR